MIIKILKQAKLRLICSIIPVFFLQSFAYSQLDEFSLFEEIPTVYAASKFEQKVSEAPASVSIVTAEEIELYGYQTLSGILASLGNFYITEDNNYTYVGTRGFGPPGDYNTRLLFLIDGNRLNDNLYDSEGTGHDSLIDVKLIDRVEVVIGPGSALYGSNAFFGTVNIITKTGQDYEGVEANIDIAENNAYQTQLVFGNRFNNGIDILLSGTFFTSDGMDKIYYPEFDSPATNNGIAANVDSEESESVMARLEYGNFSFNANFNSRSKTIPTGSYDVEFNSPINQTIDDKLVLGSKYIYDLDNTTTLTARLGYADYDYYGEYLYDYAEEGDPPYLSINEDAARGKYWGSELLLTKRFDRNVLSSGIEYRDNFQQEQKNYDLDETYLNDKRSSDQFSAFFNNEFSLNDRLQFIAGARYDSHSEYGSNLSPRVSAIYQLTEDESAPSTLRMSYGEAFRAPNAYELYYNDGGYTTAAALELDSETIETYEVSFDHYFSPGLRSSLSAYQYSIKNLIVLTLDPLSELLVFNNVDEVEAYGFDTALEGSLTEYLTGRVSYSYSNVEDGMTGKRLVNSPEHLAKISLTRQLWGDQLFGAFELQYISSKSTLADDSTGSSMPINLTLLGREVLPGLDVTVRFHNIFDDKVMNVGGVEHVQDMLHGMGRTYHVGLSYNF